MIKAQIQPNQIHQVPQTCWNCTRQLIVLKSKNIELFQGSKLIGNTSSQLVVTELQNCKNNQSIFLSQNNSILLIYKKILTLPFKDPFFMFLAEEKEVPIRFELADPVCILHFYLHSKGVSIITFRFLSIFCSFFSTKNKSQKRKQ